MTYLASRRRQLSGNSARENNNQAANIALAVYRIGSAAIWRARHDDMQSLAMPRLNISSRTPWEAIVGYSRAVRIGNYVWVAGTTATDENGRVVGVGDAPAQTRYALEKIGRALNEAGYTFADVVRTRTFVTDISQWQAIGTVHGEFFGDVRPAATMVAVSALIDPAHLVEIEVDAFRGD